MALIVSSAQGQTGMFFPTLSSMPPRPTGIMRPVPGQALQTGSSIFNGPNNSVRFGAGLNPYGSPYGQFYGSMYGGAMSGYGASNASSYDPYGGYMDPGADLVRAQGNFLVNQQQAYLLREQVRAQRTANARAESSGSVSIRGHAPGTPAERDRSFEKESGPAGKNRPVAEIWSGEALNQILKDLQRQPADQYAMANRATAPSLEHGALKQINLTTGRGHISLLKDGGRLDWPDAYANSSFKEVKNQLNVLVMEVVEQARANGRVDARTLKEMAAVTNDLRRRLHGQFQDLTPLEHVEANRFLKDLDDTLIALRRPDIGRLFACSDALGAQTVPELVQFMTQQRCNSHRLDQRKSGRSRH